MALEFLRRKRKVFVFLLVLVIISFVVLYIPVLTDGTNGPASRGDAIGTVGGETITLGEFQRAYANRRAFYQRAYQGQVDERMLRAMGLEAQVFEELVGQKLIDLEAERLGITVGDDALGRAIAEDPSLQRDGQFIGGEELRRLLELRGISPRQFEDSQRQRLVAAKLRSVVTGGVTVSPAEVEDAFRRRTEQVKVEYVAVPAATFRTATTVSEGEIEERFESRKKDYAIPEKRVVSALVIEPQALGASVKLTDAEVDRYYQEHRSEFTEAEQACASHILVQVRSETQNEGHPEAEARRIAEGLLAKVKAGGDFAALAKASSEDKGSRQNGGELGCFPRGRMVPEFDEAAFALGEGQTSELVKSSYGYHIIRVASRKAETVPPLGAVKDRITQTLTNDRGLALADEKQTAVAGLLAQGRSLEEAAKAQGLSVQKSPPFARGETPPAPLSSKAIAARAFELKAGETDKNPIRVGRGAAFIALTQVQPARPAELKDVEEKIREELLTEKTFALAQARAKELREKAAATSLDKAATALGLVRKETPELVTRSQPIGDLGPGAALEATVFGLSSGTLSEPVRTATGYAVLRVLEKKPFDPAAFEKEQATLAARLAEEKRDNLFEAFLRSARERHVVQQRSDMIRKAVG